MWATHTWWAGDGWVDFVDGDLVLRNACGTDVWRAGTTTARQLTVTDTGGLTLTEAEGGSCGGSPDTTVPRPWRTPPPGARSCAVARPCIASH